MLSDRNIDKINDQIANELQTLKSIFADEEDKDLALKRIATLNSLLNPQPTQDEMLQQLASALLSQQSKPRESSPVADALIDILSSIRR